MENITQLFKETKSNLIKKALEGGAVVLGTKIEGFAGVLLEEKEYAEGLKHKVEVETGIKGFISTDELPKYGLTQEERKVIEEKFAAGPKDMVIFVVAEEEKAKKAIDLIEDEIEKHKIFKASGPFIE